MRCAEVFARLMAELASVSVAPPLPNPPWVRWDHTDSGMWPAIDLLDSRDQRAEPHLAMVGAVGVRSVTLDDLAGLYGWYLQRHILQDRIGHRTFLWVGRGVVSRKAAI
jgi:hypothetical protein